MVKNLPANTGVTGDIGLIPGLGRGAGNGNPFQNSCLGNPVDREAWRATVHGVMDTTDPAQTLGAHTFTIVIQSSCRDPWIIVQYPFFASHSSLCF